MADSTASLFTAQWRNPSGFLSLLMIIGGPIIQAALAQLTGPILVPVCFSFGWVSYAFSTIPSLVGDGRLMPPADYACKVINLENGYTRTNRSWAIGRLLRDLERPLSDEAMCILLYDAECRNSRNDLSGGMSRWFGFGAILLQLGIAAIPFGLYLDWGIFMIVAIGTFLAISTASLRQWKVEKLACRMNSTKKIAITSGNGSRHVLVLIGKGNCPDFEDLAAAEGPRHGRRWVKYGWFVKNAGDVRLFRSLPLDFWMTRLCCGMFILLWAAVLISVLALKNNSWYLVGSGTIGMIQNAVVAAASRGSANVGIRLTNQKIFIGSKVMDVLMDLDIEQEGCGRTLLNEFFPAGLDIPKDRGEKDWWEERERRAKEEMGMGRGEVKGKDAAGKLKDRYDEDRYAEENAGRRYDAKPTMRGIVPTRGWRSISTAAPDTPNTATRVGLTEVNQSGPSSLV
jgi:hypothetical protein